MTELIDALRYCADEDKICTEQTNCGYYGKGFFCQDALMRDAADAIEKLTNLLDLAKESNDGLRKELEDSDAEIERLVAEVEHWKQAWKTTYDLLESMQKPYYEYDKEWLADRLETCAGSICSSDAPECPYREYGAFECQQKLMRDAANALRGKEIKDGVHTADMD